METSFPWSTLSEAYGFLGNSLLKPMTQTARVGLDPAFWEAFPDFGDEGVRDALDALARYADRAAPLGEEAAAEQVAVEYTRLFVGPPSPAAPPWETFYRSEGVTVGFGEATFRMRELLRAVGLEVCNGNNQYEDHLGIELLYLSVLCARVFVGDDESAGRARCAQVAGDGPVGSEQVREFIEEHPLNWVGAFRDRVAETFPEGYFCHVLTLAERILAWQRASAIG